MTQERMGNKLNPGKNGKIESSRIGLKKLKNYQLINPSYHLIALVTCSNL